MQDQYVGDIGDFGKYGLLRELFGRPEEPGSGCGLRLGVAWYLNPKVASSSPGEGDGKFIKYLCSPTARDENLKECDPVLYYILRRMLKSGIRKVAEVEQNRVLPGNTLYHRALLTSGSRTTWFKDALKETEEAEVVFVDPDNGIASENNPVGSPKHVFPDELHRFFERDKSLVIYHHLTRQGKAPEQIKNFAERLSGYLGRAHKLWALRYRRGSGRVYFIAAQKDHETILWSQLQEFKNKSCWFTTQPGFPHPHFELVPPAEG